MVVSFDVVGIVDSKKDVNMDEVRKQEDKYVKRWWKLPILIVLCHNSGHIINRTTIVVVVEEVVEVEVDMDLMIANPITTIDKVEEGINTMIGEVSMAVEKEETTTVIIEVGTETITMIGVRWANVDVMIIMIAIKIVTAIAAVAEEEEDMTLIEEIKTENEETQQMVNMVTTKSPAYLFLYMSLSGFCIICV
jgi:hypothetical protein